MLCLDVLDRQIRRYADSVSRIGDAEVRAEAEYFVSSAEIWLEMGDVIGARMALRNADSVIRPKRIFRYPVRTVFT